MALSSIQSPGAEQQRLSTAAAHQLKVRYIQRIVTPTMAFNAAQLASYNPRLDAGVVGGLAMAGLTPDDPVMDLVSQRSQYEQEVDKKAYDHDRGVFGEWVWNPLKSVIRGGFMGLEGLMQEAESAFVRTPVGLFQGKDLGQAFSDAGRSDAYYALDALMKGEKVNTGLGIFAQNQTQDDAYIQSQLATGRSLTDVMASREYRQENAQYGIDVSQMGEAERSEMQITSRGGQSTSVSLGRLAAISVFEPGTREFQMLSGVVDAGKQIWLDPSNLILGGAGKAQKLRKLMYTAEELEDATMATKAMRGLKAALVPNATRKTILARTADEWLDANEGRGFIKWIGEQEGAEGARALYEVLGKASKGAIDPTYVRQLLAETDGQRISELLKLGYEQGDLRNILKQPGGAGDFIRKNLNQNNITGTYLGRMASVTNSKVLDIENPASALEQLDLYMANLGLKQSVKDEILYRAMHIDVENMATKYSGEMGQQDLYSQYFGLVKDATNSWIDDLGMAVDDPMRQAMSKVFDSPDAYRTFWVDNLGKDVLFGGARVTTTVDGKVVAVPSAVVMSQFLNQGIPLIDSKKIRSMMRRDWVGSMFGDAEKSSKAKAWLQKIYGTEDWDKLGNTAVVNALDAMMGKVWKPSVLLRVAWPVRVIGEEQVRLSGKLMAGMFNHPLQHMALMATKDKKWLRKVARMSNDVLEAEFLDDAAYEAGMSTKVANQAEALTGKSAGRGGAGIRYEAVNAADLTDDEFAQAMVWEINQLVKDDVAREVAGAAHAHYMETGEMGESMLDDLKARFWNGDLQHLRKAMIHDTKRFDLLSDRAFAEGYIDTVYGKITQMGGGDGFLLDPYTLKWHNFSGEELGPAALRKRMSSNEWVNAERSVLTNKYGDAGHMITDEMDRIGQELAAEFPDDADMIIDEMYDVMDEVFDLSGDADAATLEAMRRGDALVDELRGFTKSDGMIDPNQAMEFIPTLEAQTGIGELAHRSNFVGMYQTAKQDALSSHDISGVMNDAFEEAWQGGAKSLDSSIMRPIDDFEGRPPISLQLADDVDDNGNGARNFVRWVDGEPAAYISLTMSGDEIVGVNWMGGTDLSELQFLADEMIDSGIMSLEEVFTFNAGGIPFNEWLMKQGVDVSGMSREDLWKYFDENPDILKRFEAGSVDIPRPDGGTFEQWKPGVNPRSGTTTTTRAGGTFTKRGVRRAGDTSSEWPQHTPYFKMEKKGDPRIFELIASGKVTDAEGATLLDWHHKPGLLGGKKVTSASTNHAVRAQFKNRQKFFTDEIDHWRQSSPGYLRRPQVTNEAKDIKRWDEAVNVMMQMLMSKPSDKLSRSPAFRQFYWQRASELAAYLNEGDRARFLSAADSANLIQKKDALSKMGQAMRTLRRYTGSENTVDEALRRINKLAGSPQRVEEGAITTLEHLDQVAKAYALEETKGLLYDLSKSHNSTEALRLMIPFGEAWFEVMSTWGKLMKENPRNIRRLQQGIQGARGSDPFRDTGPDGEQGHGFFFNDPTTGDEVFAFPGMGLIPEWMPFIGGFDEVDESLEMTGRVQGLSMMAQIMPGIGPVLQIPMSMMPWASDPDKKGIQDILLPFGKSEVEMKNPTTWLSPILPPWVNKGFQAWGGGGEDQKRLQANTTIDVYKTLLMQGWSDDSPEEMQRTLQHASDIAGDVTRIRTLAAFAAPVGANNLWQVTYDPKDVEGDVWAYSNLATAYRQILDENGGDEVQAFKSFSDIFGVDPMLFAVGKTQRVVPRAATLEARKWEYDNADLYEQGAFPLTAYFSHPDAEDDVFDYDAYLISLEKESRVSLSPEQWGLKRNQFLGRIAYANFQRSADRRFQNEEQKTLWLRNAHSGLQELFPGYGQTIPGLPAKPSLDMQIRELQSWASEPRLAESETGQALAEYLQYREMVIRLTQTNLGYTSRTGFRSGTRSAVYRRQLRAMGQSLVGKYPEFLSVWQQILSRELEEPEATMAPVNIAGVEF